MRFLLLIKHDELRWRTEAQAAQEKIFAEYRALLGELAASGRLVEADQCTASDTARSVRVREGQPRVGEVTGGTAEQVAGFILVEVASREEAIEISARVPSARDGHIEVWPVSPRQQAQAH